MQDNSVVKDINKRLYIYGKNTYGEPNFRVVFSEDQTERRRVHNPGLFIGEENIKTVKKYPYIHQKWILERWIGGRDAYHKDLVTVKEGVYVCVYAFQDKFLNYLPPLWKVCEIIIKHLLNPRTKAEAQAKDEIEEQTKDDLELKEIMSDLEIQSDEVRTKDKNSKKDSISEGYVKELIN